MPPLENYQFNNPSTSVIAGRFFLSSKPTSFRMYYDRGDIPIKMEYLTGGQKVSWTVNLDTIDFNLTLPLFFDGLCETKHPYKTYARQGCFDLINNGGEKVYPVIPQLIIPIKSECCLIQIKLFAHPSVSYCPGFF